MAAATKIFAESGGCIAFLNYDDLGLLATGVTVDNTNGTEVITFLIVINGQTLSTVVDVGKTSVITFPLTAAVTKPLAVNGITGLAIAGYSSHGIGSG